MRITGIQSLMLQYWISEMIPGNKNSVKKKAIKMAAACIHICLVTLHLTSTISVCEGERQQQATIEVTKKRRKRLKKLTTKPHSHRSGSV